MECTHLLNNVKLASDSLVEYLAITKNFTCSECGVREQVWMCLNCGSVNCGRYINGHAQHHSQSTHHQICISCDVYSVYCYQCDDYVSNDLENGAIDNIRKSLMKITNCSEDSDIIDEVKCDKSTSESSLNESNTVGMCINNNGQSIPNVESSTNCETLLNSANMDSTGSSEMKPRKQVKTDEPVRSLRPRSRKRSHSEDSSTDNSNSQQFRNSKDKKLSPCNGKSQKEKKIVGLKNLGNTCFMNAVLQSLNNIQEFSCYFSQLPSLEVKTNGRKVYHSRSYTRQDMTEVVMAEELRKVLINLKTGCGSKGAISPECLFLVIWKVVPRFRGYQQQDAHEFLRYMLDRLHTELLQLMPPNRGVDTALVPKGSSASIVTAVFGGTLQSEVRCLACGTQSHVVDPFLDLSLELPDPRPAPRDPPALADCLASFVQVEELADTERYFCSSCKCKQKSTKQFWIRRLPNVLCLHLKRFRWHNYFRTKVDTAVRFPLRSLDMSGFVGDVTNDGSGDVTNDGSGDVTPDNQLYDLAAVIVHHGTGAGSGHYTAFAINDDQWFHFNDQTVRATDAASVAACKPYILFYIRREFS